MSQTLYQIIGFAEERFTGTEPGTFVDIVVPAMMNPYVTRSDASVFRVLAQLKPGVAIEPVRAKMQASTSRQVFDFRRIGHLEWSDLFSLGRSMIRGMQVNARFGTFQGHRHTETNPSWPQSGIVYKQ